MLTVAHFLQSPVLMFRYLLHSNRAFSPQAFCTVSVPLLMQRHGSQGKGPRPGNRAGVCKPRKYLCKRNLGLDPYTMECGRNGGFNTYILDREGPKRHEG